MIVPKKFGLDHEVTTSSLELEFSQESTKDRMECAHGKSLEGKPKCVPKTSYYLKIAKNTPRTPI